ncbi:uncharacterized protein LOC111341089 [Stylophora pistillata]|uniref:uncharacterized protein LOC111341089 n=1 Tax=Stylophora pistillata TaxID=50429 RepID=UPI000C042609|nr:uncharacterized protein LOC111341089 [Stylophora pistillata]
MREIKSIVDMIVPDSSPLQGGMVFVLIMSESLPPNMDSAVAFFESVPVQVTKHRTTLIGIVPPSDEPGIVTVKVQSRDGIFLGNILFEYVDADKTYLKRLVTDPKLLQKFYMQMAEEQGKKTRESEKQPNLQPPYIVTTAGSSQAFHILATLVFAAAKYDALEPIKIILDSSNGSAVFHAYKDRAKLPESVARDHGNHDIVDYLEEATCRFYEEIKCGKECNQTVDWLELLNAAGEGQTRLNLDAEERETHRLETGRIKDSGYSADVESSTSSSSDPEGSDSERHTSTSSYEDIDYIETGVVDVGNATQHEKNYPADTNTDDTPSSFTLQEVTNLPVIEFKTRFAEDSTVVTSAGKESDIITPSTEEENTVISLAANQSGRSPSPENESGATQTVTKERDITPLVATERNVTPSAERGSDFTPSTGCDSGGNTAVPIAESTSDAKHANSKKNVSLQLAKIESVATPTKLEGVDIPQSAERDSEATPTNSKENTVPPLAEGKSDAMHANSKENTVLQSAKCKRDATPVKSKKPDGPQLAEQESDVASLLKRETGLTPSAAVNNDVMPVAAIVRIITHTASGESNITPSAEDQSDIMPSAEDESNITSSAKDDSDITPSPERERSVISSAAEENNIMSSSHKKTAFILSAPNEVDLEPLAAKARDFKPSNAKGTVESDTFIEVEKHPEEGNKNSERRLSFLSEVEKHPEKETTKLPWRVRFPFEWSKKLLEEMEEQRKKLKERREELKKYEKKREEEMEKHRIGSRVFVYDGDGDGDEFH